MLAGKSEVVKAFLPVSEADRDSLLLAGYAQLYALLERDRPAAEQALADLHERYPDDPLISLHLARLQNGESGTAIRLRGK